jgi:hypothetical protein
MHPVRHALHFIVLTLAVFFWPGALPPSDAKDGFSRELMAGKTLMVFCNSKHDTDVGLCNGYIMAIAEAMTTNLPVFGQRACGHEGIKAQQLVDLVRLDLTDRPDLGAQPAGVMVASVLAGQFPCTNPYRAAPDGIIASPL